VPPRPSSSDAELERRRVPFTENAIVLILRSAAEIRGRQRIRRKRSPSM
jgi:hypothetical protein